MRQQEAARDLQSIRQAARKIFPFAVISATTLEGRSAFHVLVTNDGDEAKFADTLEKLGPDQRLLADVLKRNALVFSTQRLPEQGIN